MKQLCRSVFSLLLLAAVCESHIQLLRDVCKEFFGRLRANLFFSQMKRPLDADAAVLVVAGHFPRLVEGRIERILVQLLPAF